MSRLIGPHRRTTGLRCPLASIQRNRGIKRLSFADTEETIYERKDWPVERLQQYFKNDTLAVIGYGSQGHGQSLNARDQGLNVVIGVRKGGQSWQDAMQDGWIPDENLVPIEQAIQRGTIVMNLLSDAAQSSTWPNISTLLQPSQTLYFSHGFSVVFSDDTGVIPPSNMDVIMVAPKGSGRTVRTLFKEGRGINSSIAIHQDQSGTARERAVALGIAIGSGYLYETTFEKEVYSDLCGERGVLAGGIQGMFLAHYGVLRNNGFSPLQAFNVTVEKATESLYPIIGEGGMGHLFRSSSTTSCRGALDWAPIFERTNTPIFEKLWKNVKDGAETRRALEFNSRSTYREDLKNELKAIDEQELWRIGRLVRSLRHSASR